MGSLQPSATLRIFLCHAAMPWKIILRNHSGFVTIFDGVATGVKQIRPNISLRANASVMFKNTMGNLLLCLKQ